MSATRRREASDAAHGGRSAARLGAVQALYQIEIGGAGVEEVIDEFERHRRGGTGEGSFPSSADGEFFADLVRGACERRGEIDGLVSGTLAEGWTLGRLELLLAAVLRAGAFELLGRSDVPARVIIDEYIEVAHAFFGRGEPGFVNGVLDRLAHELREAEFAAPEDAS